jgi:hypothetical protein
VGSARGPSSLSATMPNCRIDLFEDATETDDATLVGENCHIETQRPSQVKSGVEPRTTTIERDDTVRSGGWEIARNRLISQGHFWLRLGKKRNNFNAGHSTLNQRVQGSILVHPPNEINRLGWIRIGTKRPVCSSVCNLRSVSVRSRPVSLSLVRPTQLDRRGSALQESPPHRAANGP